MVEASQAIDNYWPEFHGFLNDLEDAGTNERVLVIVGSAMLDLMLRRLLIAFMVVDCSVLDEMVGKEGYGGSKPLSSFSSRIDACFALGLIDTLEHKGLHTVRRIRNEYAHRLSEQLPQDSFDALTNNLVGLVLHATQRDKYMRSEDPLLARLGSLAKCFVSMNAGLALRAIRTKHRQPWSGETFRDVEIP